MPYKDAVRRRQYHREYYQVRRARAGLKGLRVEGGLQLETCADILGLLSEQVALVRSDPEVRSTERARCIAYLCTVALRALEAGELEARVSALEEAYLGGGRDEQLEEAH